MGSLDVGLIGLLVGIDLQDVHLGGISLVLHGEEGDDAGLRRHGHTAYLRSVFQILFKLLRNDLDLRQPDQLFAILPHRDVGAEEPAGIVRQDRLRVQAHRRETLLQGALRGDQRRGGDVGIVGAIEQMVGGGDSQKGADGVVRRGAGEVEIQAGDVGVHIHRLHIPLLDHDGQEALETRKGIRQERAAMRNHDLEVRIPDQDIVRDHIEDGPRSFGQILVRGQRHFGDQLVIDGGRLVRMRDYHGLARVQHLHQRLQFRIAQVLAVAVGGQFHAVRMQDVQRIDGFLHRPLHVRQRQGGAEQEPPGVPGLERRTLLVVLAAESRRFRAVPKPGLRRRHRQDGGLDARLVHEREMLLHVPARNRETFVHLGPMGLDEIHVRGRDGMAVDVDLRPQPGRCRYGHNHQSKDPFRFHSRWL